MKNPTVAKLLELLKRKYGANVIPYGTSDAEEDGTGFQIKGIRATFSVAVPQGMDLSPGKVSVQIESDPPGEYILEVDEAVDELLERIEEYRKPRDEWPHH